MGRLKTYGIWVLANVFGWFIGTSFVSFGLDMSGGGLCKLYLPTTQGYLVMEFWVAQSLFGLIFIILGIVDGIALVKIVGKINWFVWLMSWFVFGVLLAYLCGYANFDHQKSETILFQSKLASLGGLFIGIGHWLVLRKYYVWSFSFIFSYMFLMFFSVAIATSSDTYSYLELSGLIIGLLFGAISGLPFLLMKRLELDHNEKTKINQYIQQA